LVLEGFDTALLFVLEVLPSIEWFQCAMNIIICQTFGLGSNVQTWWLLQSY